MSFVTMDIFVYELKNFVISLDSVSNMQISTSRICKIYFHRFFRYHLPRFREDQIGMYFGSRTVHTLPGHNFLSLASGPHPICNHSSHRRREMNRKLKGGRFPLSYQSNDWGRKFVENVGIVWATDFLCLMTGNQMTRERASASAAVRRRRLLLLLLMMLSVAKRRDHDGCHEGCRAAGNRMGTASGMNAFSGVFRTTGIL